MSRSSIARGKLLGEQLGDGRDVVEGTKVMTRTPIWWGDVEQRVGVQQPTVLAPVGLAAKEDATDFVRPVTERSCR